MVPNDIDDEIEALERRRAEAAESRAKAEKEQYKRDLEALIDLETEHGVISGVRVARFVEGHPTRAFVRTPTELEYKRYRGQVSAAVNRKDPKATSDAQDLLARSCWVYPRKQEDRDAMLAAFPGLLLSIVAEAARLAEGKAEDEGKG